ncbi:MAG: hypothetical protein IKG21_01915 [Atopobiaceae bacterium]|nr:hypothetical protein [Atopobiaceae bacterium]
MESIFNIEFTNPDVQKKYLDLRDQMVQYIADARFVVCMPKTHKDRFGFHGTTGPTMLATPVGDVLDGYRAS